jgi:outer membrane receptor for ferrienterochelin and colicins
VLRNYSRILGLIFLLLLPIAFTLTVNAEVQVTGDDAEADLEEVVVTTGTKTENKESETPVKVEVITEKELEESSAKTVEEALEYIDGINAIQNDRSSNWGKSGIDLRGMGSDYTLVLIDGQRFYGAYYNSDLSTISMDMVERIEIVKGPFSALYGSDAMGGVINIITKKRPKEPYGTFSGWGGSRETRNYAVSTGFGQGKFGGTLSYTYEESDGIDKVTDEYDLNIFSASLEYDFNSKSSLEFTPYYSKKHNEDDGYSSMRSGKKSGRDEERTGLNLKWKYTLDTFSSFYLRGSTLKFRNWTPDVKYVDNETNSTEFELAYNRLLGSCHSLTIGAQHHLEELDRENNSTTPAGENLVVKLEDDQTVNGFFIQDEMDFAPFQVVLGARIDDHDDWGTEVCPNLSVLHQFNEQMQIRGSVGKAFKAPEMIKSYDGSWMAGGKKLLHGNPDLDPEESVGYQLGMDYAFSKRTSTHLTLFRNEVDNLVAEQYDKSSSLTNVYYENIGEALIQGVELNFRTQLTKNISGSLGYTFLDTENKKTGEDLPERSKDNVSVKLDWKAPFGVQVQLVGLYMGSYFYNETNKLTGNETKMDVDSYWLLNLGLNKKIGNNYKAFLKINNLLDVDDVGNEYEIDGREYFIGMKVEF